MKNTDEPIIVEEIFNVSIDTLWSAITDPTQMRKWFFQNIESFKPEVGIKTKFEVHSEDRTFTHLWEVTEVQPGQKISYNWKYEEYPGDSFVTFELNEQEGQVKLIVAHEVVESFPDGIAEFSRESGLDGWNYIIKNSLKEYMEAV